MSTERDAYDAIVAAHYAAYRPPLHERILARAFPKGKRWSVGLDLGCGTGRSSVALAEYCDQVLASDPSLAMLDAAIKHETVRYFQGASEKTELADHSIDVVTLAGSLFYADRVRTAEEVRRVCRSESRIVVYDFQVHLGPWLELFDLETASSDASYDHRVNFQGISGLRELAVNEYLETFEVTSTQLAHVLLSDISRLKTFACRFGDEYPLTGLDRELGNLVSSKLQIQAMTYWSVYQTV